MTAGDRPRPSPQTIFMVNRRDNPVATFDESTFTGDWTWIEAPPDWTPEDGLEEAAPGTTAILVFSRRHREKQIRRQCEHIRSVLEDIPLLVAVTQYEMPLANRVKELRKTDYVFSPIEENDLVERLDRLQQP